MMKSNINFMGKRKLMALVSAGLLILSIGSLVLRGLNLGIDFTGGTLVEVGYTEAVDLEPIRQSLNNSEFKDVVVQYFGSAKDILVRFSIVEDLDNAELSSKVLDLFPETENNRPIMRRIEFVGPEVGDELKNDGGLAMIYALIGILCYVALRFQMRFSFGAIAALVHDVLIILGIFSLTQFNFDLTILAALLAVIGYSLNDTIVVFDRVRENFRKLHGVSSVEVFNISLNEMLGRTVVTSFTTLLVLIALFIFGGEIIHGFATALIIGIFVGTYSSIFVAGSVTLALGISRKDLLAVKKEGTDSGAVI